MSRLNRVPSHLRHALGVSLGVHVILGGLVAWISTSPRPTAPVAAPRGESVRMVYLNTPGPGGGGGGGGNSRADPPRRLTLSGSDAVSIPVPKDTPFEPLASEPVPEPEPPPKIVLPVMAASSGAIELDGAIFAPPHMMSQGSGSEGGAGSGEGTGSGPDDGPGLGPGTGGGTGGNVYRT
ncbi:MAG: hypothetical protein ACRD2X_02310, partial [Vicinamibacteraceae bacterium]